MNQELTQLSRTMSHALRHEPEHYGLQLDQEGWVAVQDLLASLRRQRRQWQNLSEQDVAAVLAQSEKQRFEMRDGKIRAFYGHSVSTKLTKEAATPPVMLFHGTTPQAAAVIRVEGLKSMERQYVHLSADEATARQVALRRTNQPVLLKIVTETALQHGITFYLGNDMVWLADYVPPECIIFEG